MGKIINTDNGRKYAMEFKRVHHEKNLIVYQYGRHIVKIKTRDDRPHEYKILATKFTPSSVARAVQETYLNQAIDQHKYKGGYDEATAILQVEL